MKVYLTFFRSLKAIGARLESKHTLKIKRCCEGSFTPFKLTLGEKREEKIIKDK